MSTPTRNRLLRKVTVSETGIPILIFILERERAAEHAHAPLRYVSQFIPSECFLLERPVASAIAARIGVDVDSQNPPTGFVHPSVAILAGINSATTRREKCPSNVNPCCVHSVMERPSSSPHQLCFANTVMHEKTAFFYFQSLRFAQS